MIALFWMLVRMQARLRDLMATIDVQNRDLAGLSIASASVDENVAQLKARLEVLAEQVGEIEAVNETAQPYHGVIQQVRSGATSEQLVKSFGISREEAALLIRLHGRKTR
ncbi:MAG: DUF2802 domain-containing protein [Methylococcales bacterium]|nr:DUF2802 domain-containing protein [Methylococcales bacterium]